MDRPYIFHELTNSVCHVCFRKVEAKVIFQNEKVYLHKFCPEHKLQKVLIATDIDYYLRMRAVSKPGQMPYAFNTPMKNGCPFDCGLCPDHEQHSCLTLIEITDRCNLTCPVCYAGSSPKHKHRPLADVIAMLDRIVANEKEPDVVQISGGEPTLHPDFFTILDEAKARPIRHLMVNTNGVRIAKDRAFVERMAAYMPGFEVYLQFDALDTQVLQDLRGEDLLNVRKQALAHLNEWNISTTLVVTLKKGLNDHLMGEIIEYALQQPCVRGVTFQPVQQAGRLENFDAAQDRLTLTEVRQGILDQHSLFTPEDLIPVPCHPECITMGYALKLEGKTLPLTQLVDPDLAGNTIRYEEALSLFSTAHSPQAAAQILCCLPVMPVPDHLDYNNLFRIIIMRFMDAYDLDIRSVKKSCVHIVSPDAQKVIPFDTFNLFYRDTEVLSQIPGLTP